MDLKAYLQSISTEARGEFALRCSTTPGHMTNVAYGYRACGPELAVNIERESAGAVTRRELRDDWPKIWPELERRKADRRKGEKAGV